MPPWATSTWPTSLALGEGDVRIPTLSAVLDAVPLPLMVDFTRREVVAGGLAGGAGGRRPRPLACSSRATSRRCSQLRALSAEARIGLTWVDGAEPPLALLRRAGAPSTGTRCSGGHARRGGRGARRRAAGLDLDRRRPPRTWRGVLDGRRRRGGEQPDRARWSPTSGAERAASTRRGRRTRTSPANRRWTRRSGVSSGWNDDASTGPWRTSTGTPSSVASTSTASPDRDHQRGPDEDGGQRRALARPEHDVGLEGLLLAPVAVAADDGVEHAEGALVRAPVEHLARPPARARHTSRGAGSGPRRVGRRGRPRASNRPVDSSSMDSVVDSPPGSTRPESPSRSAGRLTGRVDAPHLGQRGQVLAHVPLQVEDPDRRVPSAGSEEPATTPGRRDARRTATPRDPASPHRGRARPWPRARRRRSGPWPRRWPRPCGPGPTT